MAPPRLNAARLLAVAAAATATSAPAAAAAAPIFQRCGAGDPGLHCARLAVPLDRTGAVPGKVSLLVRTKQRKLFNKPRRGVLIALAGGPGQAAVPFLDEFAETYAPALTTRDLLVFDQRGTGGSGVLRCPALEHAVALNRIADELRLAAPCGASLGPRRASYTTPDSVEDLESLRLALGVRKLALAGTSYGTKVALAYALAYPRNVEFLVLDSVVAADGPDPFERSNLRAVPGVLRSICAGRSCNGITRDAVADFERVLARLRPAPVRGVYFDGAGRTRKASLTPLTLLDALYAGDVDPLIRGRLPAALQAFLRGDQGPIFRVIGESRQDDTFDNPRELSTALFFATSCEDVAFPWARSSLPAQRLAELRAAAQAIPDSEFAPFTRADELRTDTFGVCANWPLAPVARPVPSGPFPDVPALVLSGREDVRTPLADSRAAASAFPRGQFLVSPHSGHSVATSEGADCATAALTRFLAGKRAAACKPERYVRPQDIPAFKPPAQHFGFGTRTDRTLSAVAVTLREAAETALNSYSSTGGLRGGSMRIKGDAATLEHYSILPGYALTGAITDRGTLVVRVSGSRAAAGFLRFPVRGAVTGRLGGRPIRIAENLARPARVAAASSLGPPRLDPRIP